MTNWLAQAEHGGYYQAVADGTYAACGLEVTIQQGGPQVAGRPLLLAGKIDFYMGGNLQQAFDAVAAEHPAARRRRVLPEGAAGHHVASRPGPRQMGGSRQAPSSTSSATKARRASC